MLTEKYSRLGSFSFSLLVMFAVKMSLNFILFCGILTLSEAVENNFRLPNTTIPLHYNIWLTTHIDSGDSSFSGELTILVEVLEETPEIVVHAHDLAVTNVYLFDENMEIIEYNLEGSQHEALDFYVATPKKPLVKGKRYNVFLSYIGNVARNDGKGFFRSNYEDEIEGKSWSGSFKAAPIYARQLFPCFDEPAMKSTFLLKVMHGSSYHAISNMPVNVTTSFQDVSTITWFEKSEPIPVSQLGFLVSNFHFIEDKSGSIPLRIYAVENSIEHNEASFALEIAGKFLKVLENYLGLPPDVKKLDFAAVKSPSSSRFSK